MFKSIIEYDDCNEALDKLGAKPEPLASGFAPKPEHGIYAMPTFGGFYEVTLHPPQTETFLMMRSEEQKKYLAKLWQGTLSAFDPALIESTKMIFELSKLGQWHCHAYINMHNVPLFPIGGVCDLVKSYLKLLPTKKFYSYRNFDPKCISKRYCRYESASVCVTYRYSDESADIKRWKDYMQKAQV